MGLANLQTENLLCGLFDEQTDPILFADDSTHQSELRSLGRWSNWDWCGGNRRDGRRRQWPSGRRKKRPLPGTRELIKGDCPKRITEDLGLCDIGARWHFRFLIDRALRRTWAVRP